MERRERTRILGFTNLTGKITVIEREYSYGNYQCFLEDCSFVGEVPHTPESRTAFANNNWNFFDAIFGLI